MAVIRRRLWNNIVVTSSRSECFLRVCVAHGWLFPECQAICGEKIGL